MHLRKNLCADALYQNIRSCFDNIKDKRSKKLNYSLSDVIMSAVAIYALKIPNLLAFDTDRFYTNC